MGFVKFISKIARWANILPIVACVVMMLVVVANCILRRFGLPIAGTYDMACFLLVLIVAPAIANCEAEKGHIYLEVLVDLFPMKLQMGIGIIVNILCTAFCGLCTYGLFDRVTRFIENGQTFLTLTVPVWPFVLVEAISMALCTLVFFANIIECICKFAGKGDK